MLNKGSKEEVTKRSEGTLNTIIGKGTYVKGEVRVESNIRVDGKFDGTLKADDTLIVGATGEMNAEINVKNATVGGKIQGNLVASNSVVLEAKSLLKGDLRTKSLVINEGAQLNGHCVMGEEANRPAQQPGNAPQSQPQREKEAAVS